MTFIQSKSQIEGGGIRESLYFRNQRVKKEKEKMTLEVKVQELKCLYSSREYVYKVSLSSDDPKSTNLPNVTDGQTDRRTKRVIE